MKKYYIYYFVGGFTDTYVVKEIKSLHDLFIEYDFLYETNRFYFSRFNDNNIERLYGPFIDNQDPLLEVVIEKRKNYIMEVRGND